MPAWCRSPLGAFSFQVSSLPPEAGQSGADAVHESIAAWDLANSLAVAEPDLETDILFGARALLALEALWAEHLLGCWEAGRTSLTHSLHPAVAP